MNAKSVLLSFFSFWVGMELAFSQYIPTVVEGKEWTIELNYGLGNYTFVHHTLACDTVIQGKNYLSIYDDNFNIKGFVREDTTEQSVYILDVNSDTVEHIISYKVEVGDTLYQNGDTIVIEDVRYESLFGALRKVVVLNPLFAYIEGAGSSRYGVHINYTLPWPWPSLFDLKLTNNTCENITSTFQLSDTASVTIYPNPFDDFIIMHTTLNSPVHYKIFNITGKLLMRGILSDRVTVDTGFLLSGMYIIQINGMAIKMIKK